MELHDLQIHVCMFVHELVHTFVYVQWDRYTFDIKAYILTHASLGNALFGDHCCYVFQCCCRLTCGGFNVILAMMCELCERPVGLKVVCVVVLVHVFGIELVSALFVIS